MTRLPISILQGCLILAAIVSFNCYGETVIPEAGITAGLADSIKDAVNLVTPALVRIDVVEAYYRDGREMKSEASGSGVVITPEGHVITNHHVAGHAKQLKCVFADKSEYEAELVGTDPLTDISIILLKTEEEKTFPVASWGDSSAVRVGDHIMAMGSPLALSQSVTLGIISNTEMTMPEWMNRDGGLTIDGEDVGALVRWLAHDAQIFGGNSGGPLVNLKGEVIGINEIRLGLSGAIPINLARAVAVRKRRGPQPADRGIQVALVQGRDPFRRRMGVEPRAEVGAYRHRPVVCRLGDRPVDDEVVLASWLARRLAEKRDWLAIPKDEFPPCLWSSAKGP